MNNYRPQGSRPFNQGQGRPQDGRPGGSGGGHSQQPALETITAPYNFVPLSKKVFFPDWAGHVSHDVPFADGLSGELVCELTTHTPVYVRNGGKWDHDEVMKKEDAQSFFYIKQGNDRHFMIPGTTLKGMLRNVIEIVSFGKMNRVDDHRYGIRDLQNPNLYGKYLTTDIGNRTYKPLSMAGWLVPSSDGSEWQIVPCAHARVDHQLLAEQRLHGRQSSLSKYRVWGDRPLKVNFDCTAEMPHNHSGGKRMVYRKAIKLHQGGVLSGTIVFTGQPAPNDGRPGKKHMEFIFIDGESGKTISVPTAIKKEFQFIHSDVNEVPNEEWGYWRAKLAKGERVPVFYLTNKDGSLHSIGLAMMYRLPYANSVRQAIEHSSRDHFHGDPDLAETIFGFVQAGSESLKGRVAISPAVAIHAEQANPIQTILGGPKPSFYPNYIEQPNPAASYKTFMDEDCRIRGWKRYPARQAKDVSTPPGVGEKVDTKIIPLKENARFSFRIKLHNLKPVELGAVAWALTWGNDTKLRHSLGMGKSMGFGLVSIAVTSSDLDLQQAMADFEKMMDQVVGGEWRKSAQLEQLLAMANPAVPPQCGSLKHLFLAPGAGNEFVNAKKAKLALLPHVKPGGKADAERFKGIAERVAGQKSAIEAVAVVQQAPVKPAAGIEPAMWTGAQLGFNPSTRILTARNDNKVAEVRLDGEAANLASEEVISRLKKGKAVAAAVTVVPVGGGRFRIVRLETT